MPPLQGSRIPCLTAFGAQDRVASLERCLGTSTSCVQQHQTEDRLLSHRPMVMMQLVQQNVASSITIESVTPEVNSQPTDVANVSPLGSPHSSLSSVGANLCTNTSGFFRTNDLFCSESQDANACEQQMADGVFCTATPVADCEEQPPQSQLVWQENPEYSGQVMGKHFQAQRLIVRNCLPICSLCSLRATLACCCADSLVMRPQEDSASDAGIAVSHDQTTPCLDAEPREQRCISGPEATTEDSDYELSSQASCVEEEISAQGSDTGALFLPGSSCE